MDTFYLIHIKTIHLYQSPIIGVDRIGFPMDRNVRSIHLRSFIASLLEPCKFVGQKKRAEISARFIIVINLLKPNLYQ